MDGIRRSFRGYFIDMGSGSRLVGVLSFIFNLCGVMFDVHGIFCVGSMDAACLTRLEELPPPTGKGPVRNAIVTLLNGSMPHALLYDLTHDNESPLDKRSAEDALSTGALVTFSYSAIGSVKGFDDLYPKLLNLVGEERKYEVTGLGQGSGIGKVKRVLNELRLEMVLGGYEEGHVHQENDVSGFEDCFRSDL